MSGYIGRPYSRIRQSGRLPHADTAPVRAHIETLDALGMTTNMIARAAGVTELTVRNIRLGEYAQCRARVAEALLAVTGRPSKHQAMVLSFGVRRRLEGLHVMGWSGGRLSREFGLGPDHQSLTNYRRGVRISWVIHEQIAEVFDRIAHLDGGSTRTKRWAQRNGWVHPLLWDDIDDPHAVPVVADEAPAEPDEVLLDRVMSGQWTGPVPEPERGIAIERLIARGETNNVIADLVHVARRTVERHRAALRTDAA